LWGKEKKKKKKKSGVWGWLGVKGGVFCIIKKEVGGGVVGGGGGGGTPLKGMGGGVVPSLGVPKLGCFFLKKNLPPGKLWFSLVGCMKALEGRRRGGVSPITAREGERLSNDGKKEKRTRSCPREGGKGKDDSR